MRRVIRSQEQLNQVWQSLCELLSHNLESGILIEADKHEPPRTRRQQNKLHAMAGEMGAFCGEAKFKDEVLKHLDIWPRAEVWVTRLKEGDTTFKTRRSLPVSETRLTKTQESLVIDWMYSEAATWPGFEWKHPE